MAKLSKPVILDETGRAIANAIGGVEAALERKKSRVLSLNGTPLSQGAVIEAVGIPEYISDPTVFTGYELTEPGWYVFAQISAPAGVTVSGETVVTGAAGYIAEAGEDSVDVAVKFETAAVSKTVTVKWDSELSESFVFRANDLAIRNLDYRVTFYVYDVSPFVTWEYKPTVDATFQAGKNYYLPGADGYELAEVTAGEASSVYYEDKYTLTEDETFVEGKTYYTESGGVYSAATVTAGEAVTPDTYYEHSYVLTQDETFIEDKAYYTTADGASYSAATVTAGDAVPAVYYNHSKVIFSGMARNITYRLDEIVDCPMEFILPEIEDETHGCWFEIRCRHAGEYSMLLVPPEGVKVATEHTQKETAGINMINLHYTVIDDMKIWRFLNTHSSIPT